MIAVSLNIGFMLRVLNLTQKSAKELKKQSLSYLCNINYNKPLFYEGPEHTDCHQDIRIRRAECRRPRASGCRPAGNLPQLCPLFALLGGRGLKKAGYATDPSYANRLITIIEDYDLYKYDSRGMSKREARKWEKELKKKPWLANPHQVYIANDIAYVVARDGDTFQFLGKEFDISWRKLVKYNDLHKEYTLEAGDIIYLKDKRKKAAKPHTVYIVKDGDSMHSISQKYGIRLKNLYKMNRKDAEYVPEVGDRLRLR